ARIQQPTTWIILSNKRCIHMKYADFPTLMLWSTPTPSKQHLIWPNHTQIFTITCKVHKI
ncbi:hypothetical protein NDU88_002184, partial [Pleurodeles waltl]